MGGGRAWETGNNIPSTLAPSITKHLVNLTRDPTSQFAPTTLSRIVDCGARVVKGPIKEVGSVTVVLGGTTACGERDSGCAYGWGGVRVARCRDVRRSWEGVSARRISGVVSAAPFSCSDSGGFLWGSSLSFAFGFEEGGAGGGAGVGWMYARIGGTVSVDWKGICSFCERPVCQLAFAHHATRSSPMVLRCGFERA